MSGDGIAHLAAIVHDIKALCMSASSRDEARSRIVEKYGEGYAKLFDDSPWLKQRRYA